MFYSICKDLLTKVFSFFNLGLVRNTELIKLRKLEISQEAFTVDFDFLLLQSRKNDKEVDSEIARGGESSTLS